MTPRDRTPAPGFTLVEVLVGALVLGIFISFVYGAVVSAFNVRTVVQTTTSAMAGGTVAVEFVARDLEGAFLLVQEGGPLGFKAEDEGGDRTRLDFVTTLDSRGQEEVDGRMLRSDVTETGYRLREGDGSFVLYRREQFGVDDKPLEGGDWYKVIDGVRQFTVDFYEGDPTAEEGDEKEDALRAWDSKEKSKLPRSAKITLVIEGSSTNPSRADEVVEYSFTRWVVFPGAFDVAAPAAEEEKKPEGGG